MGYGLNYYLEWFYYWKFVPEFDTINDCFSELLLNIDEIFDLADLLLFPLL